MTIWMGKIYRRLAVCLLAGLFAAAATAGAASDTVQPLSIEQIEKQIDSLTNDNTLTDPQRQSILQNLQQAADNLKRAAAFSDTAAEYERQLQQAPATLEAIKLELAAPAAEVKLESDPAKSLAAWEQELQQAAAATEAARQKMAALEAEDKKRTARRSELPGLLAAATARRTELAEQLALPAGQTDEPSRMAQSARWALLSEQQATDAEAHLYEQELLGFDASSRELLTARRDRAARNLATAEARTAALQSQVDRQRQTESEAAAASANAARRAALKLDPRIQAVADRNAALAALRTGDRGLTARLRDATRDLQNAKDLTASIQTRAVELKQRIAAAGLTHAVAQLLRRERDNLPDVRAYRPRARARREQIAGVQLDLLDYSDQRAALLDIDSKVKALASEAGSTDAERADLELLLKEYLTAQRNQLDTLVTENNTFFNTLVDLDTAERQLVESVAALSDAIAEHILWVRSDSPVGRQTARQTVDGLVWLVQPAHWRECGQVLASHTQHNPLSLITLLLTEILLGFYTVFAGRRLKTIAAATSRIRTDRFIYTIEALVHTALRAAPVPLALFFTGWWLLQPGSSNTPFAAAAGTAGLSTSLILAALLTLHGACAPKGLMEGHFDWEPPVLPPLRRSILRIILAAAPLYWLVSLLSSNSEAPESNTLERLLFFALHLILIAFAMILLRRKSAFITQLSTEMKDHGLLRARRPILALTVGISILILIANTAGYYYTAGQMATWLTNSVALALGILLLEALLMRGIRKVARRVEFERRVKERQEALRQKDAAGETGPEIPPVEDRLDVVAISENTRRLLRVSAAFALLFGMFFIWADAVPALNLFDRVVLWTVQTESGGPGSAMLPVAISLADLFTAVLVGMITVVAARNLPGLIELAVLRHLPIAYGERYAISTIIRYVAVGTGIAMTFSMLGFGWSKIRWLLAALSVGLGFGLQEIFANFVSGLILLFERPIRVRDYVTVGGTSGQVSRIQIRATTITDFDNKELLIPNKQFVTGELVNWTLTNSVLRIVVPVGIAYGSDTKKAERILMEIARNYRLAVKDPAPSACFTGFGDSSLNFELRVYISHASKFREAQHELHMAIDDAFRKAGIVIAFPQRDVHLYPAGSE